MKNKKTKFSLNNLIDNTEDADNLTHRGKKLNEINSDDDEFVQSDDEMYDRLDNYMNEIENAPDTKLSRKEIIQNIINKSKLLKQEKQNLKRKNLEQIKMLDENFAEISDLISRRPRTLGRLNDDFERMANSYNYLDKTKPTERIKSDKEIEMEKENELKKKLKQQIREDTDENEASEDDKSENSNSEDKDLSQHPDKLAEKEKITNRPLTKKERIIKLMEKRMNKAAGKIEKDNMTLLKKKRKQPATFQEDNENSGSEGDEQNQSFDYDEEEQEEDLSDLDEFENKNRNKKKDNYNIEEEEKDFNDEYEEGEFEEGEYEEGEYEEGESEDDD